MQKIIEKGGIRNDFMKKRLDRMSTRVSDMGKRVKSIEETLPILSCSAALSLAILKPSYSG
jgi:hypothetical protein